MEDVAETLHVFVNLVIDEVRDRLHSQCKGYQYPFEKEAIRIRERREKSLILQRLPIICWSILCL
jgi:hypothetical protein